MCFVTEGLLSSFNIEVSGEFVIPLVLSRHNKNLKQRVDQHYSPQTNQLQLRVQLSFIQKVKENTSSRHDGMSIQKTRREERPPAQFWLLFLYVFFFLLPLGLPYVNWASQECCLFYLRSSLQSSDLSLFYFRGLFPSLSFSHHHSGLLFPILTT